MFSVLFKINTIVRLLHHHYSGMLLGWCLCIDVCCMLCIPSCSYVQCQNFFNKLSQKILTDFILWDLTRLRIGQVLFQLLCRLVGDLASFGPGEDFCSQWDITGNHYHDSFQVCVCQMKSAFHLIARKGRKFVHVHWVLPNIGFILNPRNLRTGVGVKIFQICFGKLLVMISISLQTV